MHVAIGLLVLGARKSVLSIIKVKILLLVKWSYRRSPKHVGCWALECLGVFWARGPISIEHVSLRCPLLGSHLTRHHSNIGVQKIAMFDLGTCILGVVYIIDHEICPMSKGIVFYGHAFMVRFLKPCILKAFGPLTRCKPNVDQDKWPCTIYILEQHFSVMIPIICSERTSFASPTTKPLRTKTMDNVGLWIGLLGDLKFHNHSYILFSWCKPKWSWDKFNGQSNILEEQGTTSWSMMWTTPYLVTHLNQTNIFEWFRVNGSLNAYIFHLAHFS